MPNSSASAVRPSSVTVSARPRGTRFTQPADRNRSNTARPSPPDRWCRCSVQSTQYRMSWPFARWYFDADAGEEVAPDVGQFVAEVVAGAAQRVMAVAARVVATVAADERLAIQQAAHDGHAEAAREVVVAGARRAQPRRAGALPQRSDGPRRCEAHKLLEQLADLGAGEPVVAVPAVGLHG